MAAGEADSAEVRAGIDYLLATQLPDGNWDEDQFTGTGFPEGLLPQVPPVSALFPAHGAGTLRSAVGQLQADEPDRSTPPRIEPCRRRYGL